MSENFIGSEITLISKSGIRYVGMLIEINQAESTVTLQSVQSHGTEGRAEECGMQKEIPASDRVFEFIVFRGRDIKDLHVSGTPAVADEPIVEQEEYQDPAIVQQSSQSRDIQQQQQQQPKKNKQRSPQKPPMQQQQQSSSQQQSPPKKSNWPAREQQQRPASKSQWPDSQQPQQQQQSKPSSYAGSVKQQHQLPDQQVAVADVRKPAGTHASSRARQPDQQQQQHRNKNSSHHIQQEKKFEMPEGEFDFSKAVMSKLIKGGAGDGELAAMLEGVQLYYKRQSFYDEISSDNKQRMSPEEARAMRERERAQNMETFGVASVPNQFGGGRGGRGGGGYRGRGGFRRGAYRGGVPSGPRGGRSDSIH